MVPLTFHPVGLVTPDPDSQRPDSALPLVMILLFETTGKEAADDYVYRIEIAEAKFHQMDYLSNRK